MTEHIEEFNIELETMRNQVRYALNNLDNISQRNDVKGKLECVYFTLDELCEQTKEMK